MDHIIVNLTVNKDFNGREQIDLANSQSNPLSKFK